MNNIKITCPTFDELTLSQLYKIMVLRQEVFVVEQDCPYLDADNKDQVSHHLCLWSDDDQLLAYARLLPKGVSYPEYASIGRVVSSQSVRKAGLGKVLMQAAIEHCNRLFSEDSIKISAQCYLIRFYEGFGFQTTGDEYLEDNLPHIAMIRAFAF